MENDDDNPNAGPPEPQYTAPPPGVSHRPALRYCGSRSSVDSGGCSRCAPKYRYPMKASNDNRPQFNRCIGCRPGLRSSIESVNSAPGRMDHMDICRDPDCSLLDPMRKLTAQNGSDESLVSGIHRLDESNETIPKMQVSPTGLQRHHSDCVHAARPPMEKPHRRPAHHYPPPPKQWNNNNECCHKGLPGIAAPPTLFRDPINPKGRYSPERHDYEDVNPDCTSDDDDTTVSGTYTIDTAAVKQKRANFPYTVNSITEDGTVV